MNITLFKSLNLCFLGTIFLLSCQSTTEDKSPLFQELFPEDQSVFRGHQLGEAFIEIKKRELPLGPDFEDPLGLYYKLTPNENVEVHIEYYKKQEELSAIIANILFDNEVDTDKFYKEVISFFRSTYGPSDGNYGDYFWEETRDELNMEVHLNLNGNKKEVSLNFINKQLDI